MSVLSIHAHRPSVVREVLRRTVIDRGGFLTNDDLALLGECDRLRQVLVRCNGGRFVVAAQCARHYCDIIDASQVDWVRDVSLLASDPACRGDCSPVTHDPPPYVPPVAPKYPPLAAQQANAQRDHFADAYCDAGGSCYSDADSGL